MTVQYKLGEINYSCENCETLFNRKAEDFNVEHVGGSERQMGAENQYEMTYEHECKKCKAPISLSFAVYEYPLGVLNMIENESTGIETINHTLSLDFHAGEYEEEPEEE